MTECCEVISDIPARQRRVLWIVLAINAARCRVAGTGGPGEASSWRRSASACSSGLALPANAGVLACLWRHRSEDINMRSLWLGSCNDMVANGVVMLAAGGVALTGSVWPGIVTGLGIAALFGASAIEVIRTVRRGRLAVTAG